MNKRSVFCVIIFSSLVFCATTFAQNNPGSNNQNKQSTCGPYKTPVITPPAGVDYKMRVAKPREDIDYKMIVINPCAAPETKTVEIKPNLLEGQRKEDSTSPVFPLLPQAKDKLKTPSEILKEYGLPARPKKDQ